MPGYAFADYHLMRAYFEDPATWGPGVVWAPTQIADVEGHLTPVNAVTADEGLFKSAINPEHDCAGVPAPVAGDTRTRFDSDTNPGGVRCDILNMMVNQLGRRRGWCRSRSAYAVRRPPARPRRRRGSRG